jgi:GNAT superfamily N-acetyltransferase
LSVTISVGAVELRRMMLDDPSIDMDVRRADQILMRAYGSESMRARVLRFLSMPTGRWVVAERGEEMLAVGGCIGYPSGGFGWIGLIATDPHKSRDGIGTAVTRWLIKELRNIGCAAVLDASKAGAPVYERLGFDDHGRTRVFSAQPLNTPPDSPGFVRQIAIADLPKIVAYDTPRFGAERAGLLRYVLEESPGRCMGAFDVASSMVGFAVAQDAIIGPVVADDAHVLSALLDTARRLAWKEPPRLMLPSESQYGPHVDREGWAEIRSLRHQRLGIDRLPGDRHLIAGQASLGEG